MQPSTTSGIFDNIVDRSIRAAMLDVALYEEVEADERLTSQAIAVVVIAAIASGIGAAIQPGRRGFFAALIITPIVAVIGYFIWAVLTYLIGTRVFQGTADLGEMLRTLGYSYAPQVLGLLSFIPCVGWAFGLVGSIWSLVAGIIAIRQALDFDTGKAVVTAIIGWLVLLVLRIIIMAIGIGGTVALRTIS